MAKSSTPGLKCGTYAGYSRHQKRGEEPCEACRVAHREYMRAYKRYRAGHPRRPLHPCGTYPAYRRHVNAGEKPCESCAEARRAYRLSRYVSTEKGLARKGRKHGDPLKPCGTYAAYIRHVRHGEVPCEMCAQAALDQRQAGRKERAVKPCGTYAAYGRHLRKGEDPCESCREASRVYGRSKYRKLRQAVKRVPECGTVAGYRKHVRSGELPCNECQAVQDRSYGWLKGPRKNTQPCGTYAAYIRHIRAGEDVCGPCQRAHLEYGSRRRAMELGATIAPLPLDFMSLLLAQYGSRCGSVWQPGAGCGKPIPAGKETLDHIIPVTKGGLHCMENFQLMHRSCNTRKGNKMPPPEVAGKVMAAIEAAGYG